MKGRQRLWWVLGGVILVFCVGLVVATYRFGWSSTGILSKSLWDWLQLLIVSLVLAIIALVFQRANSRTEQQIAKDRYNQDREIAKQRYEQDQQIALDKQHEDLLQAYLDRIAELLLKESLRNSPSEEVRNVARVRTITVLTQLDARRIGYVFTFLQEAGLMSTTSDSSVVSLRGADLRAVKWSQASLMEANLSETSLNHADLSGASFYGANLSETSLFRANLSGCNPFGNSLYAASLLGVNLSGANLREADLSHANLDRANLIRATLINAHLSGAHLMEANLHQANLLSANLYNADLSGAHLSEADLSSADLRFADLNHADLSGANLWYANLKGARVTEEQLKKAKSFEGATMPDGSIHP